ncbi:hypothetical protein [Dendronalium sp. ChiSLP03b]|nr:hypothetical protein [Dendronalium sp. ChiSLP03b]
MHNELSVMAIAGLIKEKMKDKEFILHPTLWEAAQGASTSFRS